MKVQGINSYSKPNFTAKLVSTHSVLKLTEREVLEGRFNAYRDALEALCETHKCDTLNIYLDKDEKTYIVKNFANKNLGSGRIDYCANLTDVVNELARPTSQIHKEVFRCDGSDEVYQISSEFYA